MTTKVLIIKLGYSETFDREISRVSSLGDVFRSTVILHRFKNDDVTWLTDENAAPLLYRNPYIDRILIYDFTTAFQVQNEVFDIVVNLEKVPGICAMADSIRAWKRYGFRFNPITGNADFYMFAEKAMEIVNDESVKKTHGLSWQARLYELFGSDWDGQEYILGYQPSTEEQFDIGFNYQIGDKWPTKGWKTEKWQTLERLCKRNGYSVSWQEGLDNIYHYIDWLNKSRVIVSNDSLGLHLAIALKKTALGIFGATSDKEVYFYDAGKAIIPDKHYSCRPCYSRKCSEAVECINTILPETVLKEIIQALKT